MKTKSAFTVVELLVVVSMIAILSAVSIFAFEGAQKDARDSTRIGNTTVLSEALERYYEKNGEYPSVASLVNSDPNNTGEAVASKLAIPPGSLVMPRLPGDITNAITGDPDPTEDMVAYIASSSDNNAQCQSDVNGGCDEYTLKYVEESSGSTKTIESRRKLRPILVVPEMTLSGTTTTSINASWTAVPNAVSYTFQRSTTSDFASPISSTLSTTSTSATGLTPDTEYFFRVRAVMAGGAVSDWSTAQSEITGSLAAPTGTITLTAAMSGTNARGTAGGGTCQSGATMEYQIQYQVNAGTWQAWTTGSPRDVAATEGYTYNFRAQGRCKIGTSTSPFVQSTTASVTRPVTAPTGLTITAAMSGTNARGTAGGGTCAGGTTIERQIRYYVNAGSYVAWATATYRDVAATEGSQYTFQQQARCNGTNASSGWTASTTASITRPISTPPTPSLNASTSGNITTWTSTNTCPAGTTATYERTSQQQGGAWSGWTGASTSNTSTWDTSAQGYTYYRAYRLQCGTSYTTSPWSAQSATVSYTRPITVPQATGWTHVSLGWQPVSNCQYYPTTGCKWRRFNWTAPTCPAGTVYYASRWNSYVGTKMSWDNGQGQTYRWWYGYSTTTTTSDSVAYSSAQNSHIVEYSSNVPPGYDYVRHKVIWTCRNSTTGVTGTSESYSQLFLYM